MWVQDQEWSFLSSTLEVAGVPRGVEGGVAGVSSTPLLLLLGWGWGGEGCTWVEVWGGISSPPPPPPPSVPG